MASQKVHLPRSERDCASPSSLRRTWKFASLLRFCAPRVWSFLRSHHSGDFLRNYLSLQILQNPLLGFLILFFSLGSFSAAQDQANPPGGEGKGIYAIVKDAQGEKWEGFLRFDADEISVRSQDNQEKKVPVKYIKSITLEKNKNEFPGEDLRKGVKYTVRVENSQEIFTLEKKYKFSLNTNLGLTTKYLDPDLVDKLISKDSLRGTKLEDGKPFLEDKSIIFSLEVKF